MPSGTKPPPGALSRAVATIINAALKDRDKPQGWLGARAGMSQRQVSRYLSGTRALTIDQLDDMCIALGLDFVTVIQAADRARR